MLDRLASVGLALCLLAGCGTTYALPEVGADSDAAARSMFARAAAAEETSAPDPETALARFHRVVARVAPAARRFCRDQAVDRPDKVCDLPVRIDRDMDQPNAYQTRDAQDRPYIAFTYPMLFEARTDDEIAFVLGHEYGHHIADHIDKGRQQALVGALAMAALTGATQAYGDRLGTPSARAELSRNVHLGAALGHKAYSQSFELESDVIATHIASAAGYDPVEGAKFFAKPAPSTDADGRLSFWGTHPPNAARLATVIEIAKAVRAGEAIARAD